MGDRWMALRSKNFVHFLRRLFLALKVGKGGQSMAVISYKFCVIQI